MILPRLLFLLLLFLRFLLLRAFGLAGVYGNAFHFAFKPEIAGVVANGATGIITHGNAFHRVSSTSPSRFACWANGANGTMSFPSLSSWQTNTSNDKVSKLFEGTAILTSTGALTSAASTSTAAVPLGLPSNVAGAIGRPAGEKMMGAYLVR